MHTVLLKNGTVVKRELFLYGGAAMVGDPTAYFVSNGAIVWVKPGESVDWIEA